MHRAVGTLPRGDDDDDCVALGKRQLLLFNWLGQMQVERSIGRIPLGIWNGCFHCFA